ncbi:DUF4271 domain-containing protein [Fibrella sp. HMF5405]|uniref:DUF4271 domain-containing protein n=2 Tax=Fibrella forsythiae TaxID=2817061 RepID=A0ABS3JGT9_9BACT|nr:DUF4271 domain-containing protein [Fibrella forsythiae]
MGVRIASLSVVLFLLLVLAASLPLVAQGRQEGVGPKQAYFPVHDFQQELVIYDEAFKAYVPFIAEQHSAENALSASVDIESNRHYKLLIHSKEDGFLFIDAALRRKCPAGQWQVLDIDSLYRLYRKPQLFLTLYGPSLAGNWQLIIGYPRAASSQTIRINDDLLSVRPRIISPFGNFFGVGLVFLLAFSAFLYTFFRRAFQLFYNPVNLIRLASPEESFVVSRPLSRVSLAFTLNLSFILAFLFMYVQHQNVYLFGSNGLLPEQQTFIWLLISYVIVSAGIFLLLIGKYLLIAAVGSLYKFDALVNSHYFKVIQSSLIFTTILVLLVAATSPYVSITDTSVSYVLIPFISFYLGRLAWLYLTFVRLMPVKNLYLFSYLCIVELIPLVVGIRFAV